MTMQDSDNSLLGVVGRQVGDVLNKTTEMGESLATIKEQLRGMSDLPARVRAIELKQAEFTGSRDLWARIISVIAVLIAAASVAAILLHKGA